MKSMEIKLLDAFSALCTENYREAAIRFANISIVEDPNINRFCTTTDIAYYVTLCSLYTMNRKELKNKILSSSSFKNLMELAPET